MGLDCFFVKSCSPGETAPPVEFEEPAPNLCGGMFSGHGCDGSFRGKVYHLLVDALSGLSLYEDLGPDQLLEIADALKEWLDNNEGDWKAGDNADAWHYDEVARAEVVDLERCMRAYGEARYECVAWY